jgi:ferredoxin
MNKEDGLADLIGGERKGEFVVAEVELDELEENMMAAKACPVKIIKIDEKNT